MPQEGENILEEPDTTVALLMPGEILFFVRYNPDTDHRSVIYG